MSKSIPAIWYWYCTLLLFLLPNAIVAQWQRIETLPNEAFYALLSHGDQLYAATANRLYRSDDAGEHWTSLGPIHQNDDEVVDLWVDHGAIYAITLLNGCYLSTNGGQYWQQHNIGLVGLGAKSLSSVVQRGDSIYVATYGSGVFVKPRLPVFSAWNPFNIGMPWGNVQSLSTDGNVLLAGAGGSATLARNTLDSPNWNENPFDAFNGEINIFLAANRRDEVWLGAGTQSLLRSTDAGLSWERIHHGFGLMERAKFAVWQGQDLVLLTKPNGSFLLKSADMSQSWELFSPTLPFGGLGYDLLEHQGRLFVACSNGLWVLSPKVPTETPEDDGFSLGQNLPNPVSAGETTIPFSLNRSANVRLLLFDTQARLIQQKDLGKLTAGQYQQTLNLQGLADGQYFYSLEADGLRQTLRLLIQKRP